MKKVKISAAVCGLLSLLLFTGVHAQADIKENPGINIVIDSKQIKTQNTPITVNGRTLLPLRETAVNLGVTDDTDHIIWDAVSKTVSLKKDSTLVKLKIDSKDALVNDSKVVLDTAPVIYKNRTYIPVRFVSQSFGKKVVWDADTTSAIICDEDNYNKVKDILDKTRNTMDNLKKIKINYSMEVTGTGLKTENMSMGKMDATIKADISNKIVSMIINALDYKGETTDVQFFLKDNISYTKISNGEWVKNENPSEDSIKEVKGFGLYDNMEYLAAGLTVSEPSGAGEIVLTGEYFTYELYNYMSFKAFGKNQKDNDSLSIKIKIDSTNYQVKEFSSNFEGKSKRTIEDVNTADLKLSSKVIYSDYNGDFNVLPPEGLDIKDLPYGK